MLTHGDDVEVHALAGRGWSISAIARHLERDRKTVRAYIRTWYRDVVPHSVTIEDGHILPPSEPGIGTSLLPGVLERPDATVVSSAL